MSRKRKRSPSTSFESSDVEEFGLVWPKAKDKATSRPKAKSKAKAKPPSSSASSFSSKSPAKAKALKASELLRWMEAGGPDDKKAGVDLMESDKIKDDIGKECVGEEDKSKSINASDTNKDKAEYSFSSSSSYVEDLAEGQQKGRKRDRSKASSTSALDVANVDKGQASSSLASGGVKSAKDEKSGAMSGKDEKGAKGEISEKSQFFGKQGGLWVDLDDGSDYI